MIHRYKSASRLAKVFIWLSIGLLIACAITYVEQLQYALNMDPTSYNCTSDSMMMQTCHDPYGSSVGWAIIGLVFLGWPFVLAWLVLGIVLLVRKIAHKLKNTLRDSSTKAQKG